jgi:hypothetical protein
MPHFRAMPEKHHVEQRLEPLRLFEILVVARASIVREHNDIRFAKHRLTPHDCVLKNFIHIAQ